MTNPSTGGEPPPSQCSKPPAYILGEAIAVLEFGLAEQLGSARAADIVASEMHLIQGAPGRVLAMLTRAYHAGGRLALIDAELGQVLEQMPADGLPRTIGTRELGTVQLGYYARRERGSADPRAGAVACSRCGGSGVEP